MQELLEFRTKPAFKEYGFGTAGPFNSWLKRVEKLRDEQPKGSHQIPFELRVAPGDLLMLGLDSIKKEDSDYWRRMLPEIQEAIGFADYLKKKQADSEKTADSKFRTWRDLSGKFAVEAVFVAIEGDSVTLKKMEGSVIKVPLRSLSEADRDVVKRLKSSP